MSTPLLALQNITLAYGRTVAARDITIEVPEGRVVTLIGANGAGKSTILRGISGFLKPQAGTIRLDGVAMEGAAPHTIVQRGVVQVPEGRQVFADMTIAENLALGAYLVRDANDVRRRREAVLARFPRLAERLNQSAGLLSGGEQQMLAMGRALMANPRLLLLDEPSMGLAPLFVEEIFAIIRALKAEGRTILLVEQNAQAALEIADTAYVLESGRITLSGPAAPIAHDPRVMAAYLGGA